jgi:uncharacterized protein YifE (UPF0438 family)
MSQPQLTPREEVLLKKHLAFYQLLENGKWNPTTNAQKHFVAICRGHGRAETEHEKAYTKYLRIRALQRREQYAKREAHNGIPEYEEGYPRSDWFTDDDWKKMRRQDFVDMNHRRREL